MNGSGPSPEFLVCAGAFASVVAFKYLVSRAPEKLAQNMDTVSGKALDCTDKKGKGGRDKARLSGSKGVDQLSAPEQLRSSVSHEGRLPVIGLDNLGNTCYLNSLMQAIVCIPEFLTWIRVSRTSVCSLLSSYKPSAVLSHPPTRFRKPGVPISERRVRNFFHSLIRVVDVLDHRSGMTVDCYAATSLIGAMFDGMGSGVCNFQQDQGLDIYDTVHHALMVKSGMQPPYIERTVGSGSFQFLGGGAARPVELDSKDPDELFLFIVNLLSRAWALHRFPIFAIGLAGGDRIVQDVPSTEVVVIRAGAHVERLDPATTSWPWVSQPFQGLLYQDVLCVCCRKSRPQPLEIFNSLSLSLPVSKFREVYLLENLLRKHFATDDLDAVECTNCPPADSDPESALTRKPRLTPHLKRTSIARLPKILCLHIRRAVWSGTDAWKRRDPVSFSSMLFMEEHSWLKHVNATAAESKHHKPRPRNGLSKDRLNVDMTESHQTNGTVVKGSGSRSGFQAAYVLKSVVVHVGESSTRGHIVAYRKGPVGARNADCWYYTSDNVVRQTSWAEVESADPYILFYELKR